MKEYFKMKETTLGEVEIVYDVRERKRERAREKEREQERKRESWVKSAFYRERPGPYRRWGQMNFCLMGHIFLLSTLPSLPHS